MMQMIEIASAEERRAGQGVSDRVCDRTFALCIVTGDCGHRTERPFLLGSEPTKAGDLQSLNLQSRKLCHHDSSSHAAVR